MFSLEELRRIFTRNPFKACLSPLSLRDRQLVLGLGAMKCGTTWLSDYLASHPDFFHSPIKEMRVFSDIYRDNPAYTAYVYENWDHYRLYRYDQIVLGFEDPELRHTKGIEQRKRFDKRQAQRLDRLKALAKLGKISTKEEYLAFFAERIGSQVHFGEISPSYSHLPPEAYDFMSKITNDVRFLFLMRDPTDRAASHLRHLRRRVEKEASISELLELVNPISPVFVSSDYRYTISTLRSLGFESKTKFIIYESLFSQETLDELCDWLGLRRHLAVVNKRLNPGIGASLTEDQLAELRDRLSPIYDGLRHDPVTQSVVSWRW